MIRINRGRIPGILYLVFLLVFLTLQPIRAQDRPAQTKSRSSPKNWQLKFSVGPNLMLNQFDGFKIYLQRGLAGSKAIRFGAGLQNYDENLEYKYQHTYPTGESNAESAADYNQSMVSVECDFIRYFENRSSVIPYLGIGPLIDFSFRRTNQTSGINDDNPGVSVSDEKRKIIEAGLSAILGAEWHLKGPLVLHAEYNLRFLFEKYTNTRTTKNSSYNPELIRIRTSSDNRYGIEPANVKAGLSIAF